MSTVFVLKNTGPADFPIKTRFISNIGSNPNHTNHTNHTNQGGNELKSKFDIINPGKVSHVNSAGTAIRVFSRGNAYTKDGNPYDHDCGKPCFWHRMTFDGIAMGIPIRISASDSSHSKSHHNSNSTKQSNPNENNDNSTSTIKNFTSTKTSSKLLLNVSTSGTNETNNNNTNNNNSNGSITEGENVEADLMQTMKPRVYMDLAFCSYSCAYAYLIEHHENKIRSARDPNYAQSLTLLKQLYDDEFPGEKLEAARDWKLLKTVGNGTMDVKEFCRGLKGIRVISHPNYHYVPIVQTYDILK